MSMQSSLGGTTPPEQSDTDHCLLVANSLGSTNARMRKPNLEAVDQEHARQPWRQATNSITSLCIHGNGFTWCDTVERRCSTLP